METQETMDLRHAIDLAGGPSAVAKRRGISAAAVVKWCKRGRLPRTDYSGETDHASDIVALIAARHPHLDITREQLLGLAPEPPAAVVHLVPPERDLHRRLVEEIVALPTLSAREQRIIEVPPERQKPVIDLLALEYGQQLAEAFGDGDLTERIDAQIPCVVRAQARDIAIQLAARRRPEVANG